MSKELEALDNVWYGQRTTENYQCIKKALEALDIIRKSSIIKVDKLTDSLFVIRTPETLFYVSEKRYNLFMEVFK